MKTHMQRGMALAAVLLLGVGGILCLGDGAGSPLYLQLTGANGQQLSWPSITGARYTVQASTDLVAWHDVDVVTASATTTEWTDPFPRTGAKGFYRVILPQPQVRRVEPSVVQSGTATTVYFIGECFASGGSIWIDGVQQASGTLVFDSTSQMHAALTLAAGEHTIVIKDAAGSTLAGGTLFVAASASGLKIEVPPGDLPPSLGLGSASDRGKRTRADLDPLQVTKTFDKSSPRLANVVLDGKHLKEVKINLAQDPPKITGPLTGKPHPDDNMLPVELPPFSVPIKSFIAQDECGGSSKAPGAPNYPGPPPFIDPKHYPPGYHPVWFWHPTKGWVFHGFNHGHGLVGGPIRVPPAVIDHGNAPAMPWRGDVPMDSINCSYSGSGLEVTPAGEVCLGGVDLAIPSVGLDLVWTRRYRSRLGADSALGMGWDFSYNIRAQKDSPTQVTVFDGNGRADVFRQQASGAFECAERFESGALSGGTVFTLTFADGGKWEFGAFGALPGPANLARVVTIRDRNNNAVTCAYDGGTGRLLTVSDAFGRSLAVAYDGAGWIQSVTDHTGRAVVYTHDAAGDLTAVRSPIVVGTPHGNDSPAGKTISFTYSSGTGDPDRDHNLLTITDALAQTPVVLSYFPEPVVANVEYDRVERAQIGAVGQDIVFRPTRVTPTPANGFVTLKNHINDRNGHLTEILTDSHNRVRVIFHWNGPCTPGVPVTETTNRPGAPLRPGDPAFYKTEVEWNSSSCWIRLTQPRGNTIERHYLSDLRVEGGVPAPHKARLIFERQRTDAPGVYDQDVIITGRQYDERFGADRGMCFPTQIIDERGYATQFTYDSKANLTSVKRARVIASPAAPTTNTMVVADCAYNAAGQLTSVLGPHNGNQRRLDTFAYYGAGPQQGWLASVTCDSGGLNLATLYEHNSAGVVTRIVDPRGNDTLITLNALNQAVRIEGPLVTLATPRRQRVTVFYNANNHVSQMDTLNFDNAGIVSANAELTTTIARDVLNLPTLITQEIDAVTTRGTQFIYDAERNCTQVLLPMAVALLQPANRLAIAYDERNLPYTITAAPGAPEQSTTRYDYDANANCTVITQGTEGAQPRVWTMQHSPFRYSADYSTAMCQDSGGGGHCRPPKPPPPEICEQEQKPARCAPRPPLTYCVDDSFKKCWWKPFEPLWNCVEAPFASASLEFAPESGRFPVRVLDPGGNEARTYRDPAGNVVLQTYKGELNDVPGSAGNVTLYQSTASYDFRNLPTTTSTSHFALTGGAAIGDGSRSTSVTWTDAGALATLINDRGFTTTLAHDRMGRVATVTDANGNTLVPAYDANSNVITLTSTEQSDLGNPAQVFIVNCAYDEANRTKQITDNVGNQTTLAFDSRSNVTKLVNPRGNAVLCVFDGLSRLTKCIRDADGGLTETAPDAVTQTAYDLDSRVVSRTDDNGNVTQFTHDPLNRVKLVTFADGTTRNTTYDVHHNAVTVIDANGSVITAVFDLNNRIVLKNIAPGPGVAPTTTGETFNYDGASHLTADTSSGTVNHTFARTLDSFGNLLTESQDGVPVVVSAFDALGNRLTCAYPSGRVVTTNYDSLNRASIINDTTGAVATCKYIGPDRIERIDYGNGTRLALVWDGVNGAPNAPGDFGFRHVARTTHTHVASSTVLDDRSFAWDRNQNKTQRKDLRAGGPQLTHDYTYDQLDRLTVTQVNAPGPVLVRQTTYNLDGVDNRLNVAGPGTPDPGPYTRSAVNPPGDAQMNQYTTTPLGAHTYDANGNQTARGATAYVFDYRNRLVAVTGIPVPESYEYDALGRRVKKVAGPVTTQFNYTGGTLVGEVPGVGAARDYVGFVRCVDEDGDGYGDGTAGKACVIRNPVDAWLHTDDLGNTMALTDATGSVVERLEYEDYGQPRFFNAAGASVPASLTGNPWLFRGLRYEHETGLYAALFFDGYESSSEVSPITALGFADPRTGVTLQRSCGGGTQDNGTNGWMSCDNGPRADPWRR